MGRYLRYLLDHSTSILRQIQNASMNKCLNVLYPKSYDKNSFLVLKIFLLVGVVVIGIAGIFEALAQLNCNPDKTFPSDLLTQKYIVYIETQCFLKYTQQFYPSLPIYALVMLNFGIVCLLNIIYAHLVKDRVEIFTEQPSARTSGPPVV